MSAISGVVIPTDGNPFVKEFDTENLLFSLQESVNGMIEFVGLKNGLSIYLNEEGKLKGLEGNHIGSALFPYDQIVGPVVILGPIDEEGYDTGLSQTSIDFLLNQSQETPFLGWLVIPR